MLDQTWKEFIDALASKSAVPGGGSASALVGSIGMALGSMVGNLTVGKKKYADVEEEIKELIVQSEALIVRLQQLMEKDMAAFEPLSKAYGMPAETPEEARKKEETMQSALVYAAMAPLEIAEACVEAIDLLDMYAQKGSKLVISDAGTGVVFCKAALRGAKLNVLVNLQLMKDETIKASIAKRLEAAEKKGLVKADSVYTRVEMQLI